MSVDAWLGWKPPTKRGPRPPQPEPTTEFGALLRSLRHRRGLSQSKFAELAEFDHSYVSRLETGTRMPTKEAVQRLAGALSLSDAETDSLLASAGFMPRDVGSLLTTEPTIARALDVLADPAVPDGRKEQLRAGVGLLVAMVGEG